MVDMKDCLKWLEVASDPASGSEERVEAMKRLDALASDRAVPLKGDMRHYLQNRSYQKAISFLLSNH